MNNSRIIHNKGNSARLHCNIASAKEYLFFILDAAEFILTRIEKFKEIELTPCSVALDDIVICGERLFYFVAKDKYFSVNFPLNINEKKGAIHLKDIELNLSSISHIRGALDDLFSGFLKGYRTLEESNTYSSSVLSLKEIRFVEQILSSESGYVRYDYDKGNENGRFHPLNHLDFNYNRGTFKIGLYQRLSPYEFINLFGCIPQKECSFLERILHPMSFRNFIRKIRALL